MRLDRVENVAVAYFYSDFTAQKEQSSANMLGALKRVIGALGKRLGGIAQAYEDHKKAVDGWGRQLSNIMKMPQPLLPTSAHSHVPMLPMNSRQNLE